MRGLIPIAGRLNPSHYALLYYTKGDKPKVFNKQRIPMATCRHCGGEIHDYGGKKKDIDEHGLSIADVWTDIHPVRHKKFKTRNANELPVKLLHRVISLATNRGDIVFDPFGGSGTTYSVAEQLGRRWIGCEIGSIDTIVTRLQDTNDADMIAKINNEMNMLFTDSQRKLRTKNGHWLPEDFKLKAPKVLEASIGGFAGPLYSVKLDGNVLNYKSLIVGETMQEEVACILPTPQEWQNFWETMDKLDVWSWSKQYDNKDIVDGIQWSFKIKVGKKKMSARGSNSYPPDVIFDQTAQFKNFCDAISLLLGGKDFG